MKIKSVLKVILFGGLGSIVIGIATGQWIKGIIFCLALSSISVFSVDKTRRDQA